MGYNSVLMLLNDHFDAIDKDPVGWWDEAKQTLFSLNRSDVKLRRGVFGFRSSVNGFQAVLNQHMDSATLIMVSGNNAEVVATGYYQGNETEKQLLQTLAEKHGYRLVKKKQQKALTSNQ